MFLVFLFFVCSLLTWVEAVVELFPVVQPNLDQTGIIVIDNLRGAAGERVRRRLAKHVTHAGAGRDLEHAAAHPHLGFIFVLGFQWGFLCVWFGCYIRQSSGVEKAKNWTRKIYTRYIIFKYRELLI